MEKTIWSEDSLDRSNTMPDVGGLDAARGLVIGLALSQVFWVALAYFIF